MHVSMVMLRSATLSPSICWDGSQHQPREDDQAKFGSWLFHRFSISVCHIRLQKVSVWRFGVDRARLNWCNLINSPVQHSTIPSVRQYPRRQQDSTRHFQPCQLKPHDLPEWRYLCGVATNREPFLFVTSQASNRGALDGILNQPSTLGGLDRWMKAHVPLGSKNNIGFLSNWTNR